MGGFIFLVSLFISAHDKPVGQGEPHAILQLNRPRESVFKVSPFITNAMFAKGTFLALSSIKPSNVKYPPRPLAKAPVAIKKNASINNNLFIG